MNQRCFHGISVNVMSRRKSHMKFLDYEVHTTCIFSSLYISGKSLISPKKVKQRCFSTLYIYPFFIPFPLIPNKNDSFNVLSCFSLFISFDSLLCFCSSSSYAVISGKLLIHLLLLLYNQIKSKSLEEKVILFVGS